MGKFLCWDRTSFPYNSYGTSGRIGGLQSILSQHEDPILLCLHLQTGAEEYTIKIKCKIQNFELSNKNYQSLITIGI